MVDIPAVRLNDLVALLTGMRGLGAATRTRQGSAPYSMELDFKTTDLRAVRHAIAWAGDQAPYADVALVSEGPGLVTILARVDPPRLAAYLAGRALLQATGELWDPKNDPLAALVQQVIDSTAGSGESWDDMLNHMQAVVDSLNLVGKTLVRGTLPPPP